MHLSVRRQAFPLARAFTISRGSRSRAEAITVEIEAGGATGRGECVPYARYGETLETVEQAITALPSRFDRTELQELLPSGAARNAVDCALWDLEAKRTGRPVWQLAGLPEPRPVVTAFTLSLDAPAAMRAQAAENAHRPLLKVKLGQPGDLERLAEVRLGAPAARIILDANEGWTQEDYAAIVPALADLGVELVEQPFPAGDDAALDRLARPVPICADESCHDRASLPALAGRYDFVNIKLDKAGGLTEALALAAEARARGFRIMVGCMLGSSLAMAPALLLAQGAEIVDLDGPLLLAEDRVPALVYDGAWVHPPAPELWG